MNILGFRQTNFANTVAEPDDSFRTCESSLWKKLMDWTAWCKDTVTITNSLRSLSSIAPDLKKKSTSVLMTKLALVGSSQAVGHKNTQNTANTSGHLFHRAHRTCMHLGIFIYCWCLKHPYDDPDYRKTFSYISWLYASAREDPGCLSTVQEWIVIVAISALEGRNVSVMLQCTPTANQSHGHIHSTPSQQISEQLKNNHHVCVCVYVVSFNIN